MLNSGRKGNPNQFYWIRHFTLKLQRSLIVVQYSSTPLYNFFIYNRIYNTLIIYTKILLHNWSLTWNINFATLPSTRMDVNVLKLLLARSRSRQCNMSEISSREEGYFILWYLRENTKCVRWRDEHLFLQTCLGRPYQTDLEPSERDAVSVHWLHKSSKVQRYPAIRNRSISAHRQWW